MIADELLVATGLVRRYPVRRGLFDRDRGLALRAVDGVDLAVRRGETLAIVGESGCGKSTLARLLLGLERPDEGEVVFDDVALGRCRPRDLRALRARLQLIFQDPFSSLNPRMTAAELIEEPLQVHRLGGAAERARRVREMAGLVGLPLAALERFPHAFSGGQRQRIGIARALVTRPTLVVGDEPVSALDVSVQAQVVNLLGDLKRELGLTLVIITHDLGVVRHMADRVGVMYLGKLVELAPRAALFGAPGHPYSRALLDAVPLAQPGERERRPTLEGDLPSPLAPPPGCRFHSRCRHAAADCARTVPALEPTAEGALVACLRRRELPAFPLRTWHRPPPQLDQRLRLWAEARRRQDADATPPDRRSREKVA